MTATAPWAGMAVASLYRQLAGTWGLGWKMETDLCKTIWIMWFHLLSCKQHQAKNVMIWGCLKKKKSPSFSVALRDMFQVRLPAGCFRLVPAPSAEKLSWGTSVSISHMSNVTSEATIQERAVWGPHSSDFPLNLCIWCFTGAVSQLPQLLAQCAFWWWDWSWQSLGCSVWAVTWLGDKEATRPLYFTL